jgi:hypothetical protein
MELGVDSAPQGDVSIEANEVDPQPGDDAGTSPHDLVVRSASLGTLGCTDPSGAMPGPGSSGAGGSRIIGLLLGLCGSSSLSINWRQVEDNTEYACSQVTVIEKLL